MLTSYDMYILKVTREELAPRLNARQLVKRIAETYNDPMHPFNIAQREIYATQLDKLRADEVEVQQEPVLVIAEEFSKPLVETGDFYIGAQSTLKFWGGAGGKRNGMKWAVSICTVGETPSEWIEIRDIDGNLQYIKHRTVERAAQSAAVFKEGMRA